MAKNSSSKRRFDSSKIFYLNPRTCGVYKNGGSRFKVDEHGRRTNEIDNELLEQVVSLRAGNTPPGSAEQVSTEFSWKTPFVPRYHDPRWDSAFDALVEENGLEVVSLGELLDSGILIKRFGHGSPGGDQRVGSIPYIKVVDLRNLRININPTNLVPFALAKKIWGAKNPDSGLHAWDLLTPIRASSNIGEFAVLLPGEEQLVLTKEILILRVNEGLDNGWDPFYLLWALSLKAVRQQWQRVTLMQTNREDIGDRYREIRLPKPKSKTWAQAASKAFRDHFTTIATSKQTFAAALGNDKFQYIASAFSAVLVDPVEEDDIIEVDAPLEGSNDAIDLDEKN